MKRIKIILIVLAVCFSNLCALAQSRTVEGRVIDAQTGEGIPFASLMVKGTMNGAASDADGNYSIAAEDGDVLVFSSIGYQNLEMTVGRDKLDVVALSPDSESLEETIVVAYGVQKKSSFVGAASQVSGDKLKKMQATNISKSLEGAIAGLQTASSSGTPGSGSTV